MKRILVLLFVLLLAAPPAQAATPQRGIAMACGKIDVPRAFDIVGWHMSWSHATAKFADPTWVPMVRCWNTQRTDYPCTSLDTLAMVANQARQYPGRYWLLGNEPNDPSQDNWTVLQAVHVYSSMGRAIKQADPTARFILGGVNMTPDRNDYVAPQNGPAYMRQVLAMWPPDVPLAGLQWHIYLQDYWPTDGAMPSPYQRIEIQRGREAIDAALAFTQGYNQTWETWITEFGVLGARARELSVRAVAHYIMQMRRYMEDRGINRYAWFTWDDRCMQEGFFSWSLVDSSLLISAYRGY